MQFAIKNLQRSINDIMRHIGYTSTYFQNQGEFSIVRKLSGSDYPRFHLYIKEKSGNFVFNLHLDQKKPSYNGSHKHSGEYNGEIIEAEVARIKDLL